MRKLVLLLAILLVALTTLGGAATKAEALLYETSYCGSIAWTWTYNAGYTNVYNCLAYAMGYTDRWLWPWSGYPTVSQVNTYMNAHYHPPTDDVLKTDIIAYGWSGEVRHFSRTVTESPRVSRSKVGWA